MAGKQRSLAIHFADLGGSTQLYDRLGDAAARDITATCVRRISDLVIDHGGRIIKTIGDEVMSTFPSAGQAANASCAMQTAMEDPLMVGPSKAGMKLTIHVGFHFGSVIEEAGDVFGDAVNVAARIVGLAKSGQILTTQQTADTFGEGGEIPSTRRIDRRRVKGKQEELDIIEVIWEHEELTALFEVPAELAALGNRLILRIRDHELTCGAARSEVSIGRSPEADLVIDDSRASRWHAQIEFMQGKFMLRDNSTNGTYVISEGGRVQRVHREEFLLSGSGTISLSRERNAEDGSAISFRCESD